jgi:hypothetical protein
MPRAAPATEPSADGGFILRMEGSAAAGEYSTCITRQKASGGDAAAMRRTATCGEHRKRAAVAVDRCHSSELARDQTCRILMRPPSRSALARISAATRAGVMGFFDYLAANATRRFRHEENQLHSCLHGSSRPLLRLGFGSTGHWHARFADRHDNNRRKATTPSRPVVWRRDRREGVAVKAVVAAPCCAAERCAQCAAHYDRR